MPEAAVSLRGAPDGVGSRTGLAWNGRLSLVLQAWCARLAGPLTVPAIALAMRFIFRWRIRDHCEVRRRLRATVRDHAGPMLIAANHLTYFDSAVIAWALAPVWWLVVHSSKMPWNVPERKNFAASLSARMLAYFYKCLPITRGGDRAQAILVLSKLNHLLRKGEPVLMFPEGGRSSSGRVDRSNATHRISQLVKAVPGTKLLCVYVRGDHQVEA